VIVGGADRTSERLDNSLRRLKRIPPVPFPHPFLDQLVSKIRIRNLADNLEATEITLQINTLSHGWGHEDSRFLAAEMLVQRILTILRFMGKKTFASDVLHDVVSDLVGMTVNDSFLFRVSSYDLSNSLCKLWQSIVNLSRVDSLLGMEKEG